MSDHMLRAVLASALLVLGCGGGGGNDVDLTPPNGFWVSPSRAEVAMGWSVNLAAVGVYSGATDVTTAASWSSDAPEIATVQAGVVTGVREGTATITASLGKSTSTAVVTVGHHLKAFVTPVNGTANFSTWAGAGGKIGLAAADAICQASAQAAGLPRVFRAWLSDSRNDASCRVAGYAGKMYPDNCGQATRPTAGPWVRMDGFPFASLDKLYDYDVHVPIRFDTYGAEVDDVAWIFPYGGDVVCEDWTSSAKTSSSTTSLVYTPRYVWSLATQQSRSLDCNGIARLLCLEVGVGAPAPIPPSSSRVAFVTSVMGTGQLSSWPESGGKDDSGFGGIRSLHVYGFC